jgi:hypothetical protein
MFMLLWFVVVVGFDVVVVWVTQAAGTFNAVLVEYYFCQGLGVVLTHVTYVPSFAVGPPVCTRRPPSSSLVRLGYCSLNDGQ